MMSSPLSSSGRTMRVWRWVTILGCSLLLVFVVIASAQIPNLGAQNPNWPTELPPRPLAAREVPFPDYEVRALANGLQVMVISQHEQPAVTMHLLIRAGAAQDPDKRDGVSFLAAQLLDQGTTTRSAEQIADQIDSIGGSMGTSAGDDRSAVTTVVMKDSVDLGMNLLADVAKNPAFDPKEIERQKQQMISSLQVNAEDPEYVANVVFDRLVYGFHPYGLPGSGTPETIAGITREDLQTYHRHFYVPNNMILAIVGDITSKEAFAAAEKVFGVWARSEVPAQKPVGPPPPTRRVIIIDKPDSVQTEIRVGQLAIPRKHPDYMAWDLAVKILGGEGANRLHRVLRSERGLTYGASASTEARKQAGDYVAETDTRTETTGEALRLIRVEMERLLRQRVSERELGDAQAYLEGSFPLTLETPTDIAAQVLNAVFYELPLEEISTFRERVRAVTPDDVQRVAQKYILTDRLSVVLVGNAKAFVPQLRDIGLTDVEVIPIAQLDLTAATLRRDRQRVSTDDDGKIRPVVSREPFGRFWFASAQAPAPAAPRTPAQPATPSGAQPRGNGNAATELVRRVVDARGGLAALKNVRSVVAETETTFLGEQGDVAATSKTKTYVLYPDKFRVDATVQGDVVSQIYNAGQAWEKSPGGVRELPPQVRDEAAASVRRDMIPLLIAAAEGQLTSRVLADERGADGSPVRVLELWGAHLEPVRLSVDDQMMVVKQSFSTPGPGGKAIRAEETFSDYRLANGVRVPFQASVSRDGQVVVRRGTDERVAQRCAGGLTLRSAHRRAASPHHSSSSPLTPADGMSARSILSRRFADPVATAARTTRQACSRRPMRWCRPISRFRTAARVRTPPAREPPPPSPLRRRHQMSHCRACVRGQWSSCRGRLTGPSPVRIDAHPRARRRPCALLLGPGHCCAPA